MSLPRNDTDAMRQLGVQGRRHGIDCWGRGLADRRGSRRVWLPGTTTGRRKSQWDEVVRPSSEGLLAFLRPPRD